MTPLLIAVSRTATPKSVVYARSSSLWLLIMVIPRTTTLEIKLSVDPETTDAEIDSMIVMGVNALADSEFVEFWRAQSLS